MPRKYGLLTENQLRVLKLRAQGLTLREIASMLNVSHQSVAAAEKSAIEKIKLAKETLVAYKLATSPIKIIVEPGTKLVDIPRIIVEESDKKKIKVKGDFTLIFKLIRFKARECLEANMIREPVMIVIDQNGEIDVYPYESIKQLYRQVQEL